MAETFDVLGDVDDLLEVLVLPGVEDRVVDNYPIDVRVGVRGDYGVFDIVLVDLAEGVAESTVISQKSPQQVFF